MFLERCEGVLSHTVHIADYTTHSLITCYEAILVSLVTKVLFQRPTVSNLKYPLAVVVGWLGQYCGLSKKKMHCMLKK